MKQPTRPRRSVRVARISARKGGEPDGSTNRDEGQRGRDWRSESWSRRRPLKKRVTMYMDADVLAWFKSQGPRYQREINQMLRRVMMEGKGAG